MIFRATLVTSVITGAAFFLSGAIPSSIAFQTGEDDPLLPAAYQLVGVEMRLETLLDADSSPLSSRRIVVDLGDAANMEQPAFDDFQDWTIIGERGWAPAAKYDIEKRCDYLCGGEEESCYYAAIVSPQEDRDIGAPLAAIPGAWTLADYHPLEGEPTGASSISEIANQSGSNEEAKYSGIFDTEKYRVISSKDGAVEFEFQWNNQSNTHEYLVSSKKCFAERYAQSGLINTVCDELSILSHESKPLLASYADYNSSKTSPITVFSHNDARYYVIRYGSKAQDIIGWIVNGDNSWSGEFLGRNHALLC